MLLSSHVDHNVGCMDCHEPHARHYEGQAKKPGNELCVRCHDDYADAVAYRRHSAHDPAVAECKDCHMPYTAKSINAFDIRSHTFKPITPAVTMAQGGDPEGFSGPLDTAHIPNSCNSSCHNGVGPGPEKPNALAQLGYPYIQTLNGTAIDGDINHAGTVDLHDFRRQIGPVTYPLVMRPVQLFPPLSRCGHTFRSGIEWRLMAADGRPTATEASASKGKRS